MLGIKIGTSQANMQFLTADLGIPEPNIIPQRYSERVTTLSGKTYGIGWKRQRWQWRFLRLEDAEILRTYIPGDSAKLYIRTVTGESSGGQYSLANYIAWLIWPVDVHMDAGAYIDFEIDVIIVGEF